MPLTVEAVVIYLGVVLAGCAVVSIADSFAAREIEARLRIAGARAIFTQVRGGLIGGNMAVGRSAAGAASKEEALGTWGRDPAGQAG